MRNYPLILIQKRPAVGNRRVVTYQPQRCNESGDQTNLALAVGILGGEVTRNLLIQSVVCLRDNRQQPISVARDIVRNSF